MEFNELKNKKEEPKQFDEPRKPYSDEPRKPHLNSDEPRKPQFDEPRKPPTNSDEPRKPFDEPRKPQFDEPRQKSSQKWTDEPKTEKSVIDDLMMFIQSNFNGFFFTYVPAVVPPQLQLPPEPKK